MRIALLLLIALASGSAQAEEDKRAAIVGNWVSTVQEQETALNFLADGTFSGHVAQGGKRVWTFGGNWLLAGQWLHFNYSRSDRADIAAGTKDRDRLLRVNADVLVLETGSGPETFRRRSGP